MDIPSPYGLRFFRLFCHAFSTFPSPVIIHNFHVVCFSIMPAKTDSKLAVDANPMLPTPITVQRFQPVSWRSSQIFKHLGVVDHFELPHGRSSQIAREPRPLSNY